MVGIEVLFLLILIALYDVMEKKRSLNIDDICLRVQAIVIIPSEFVYAENLNGSPVFLGLGCLPCFCCFTPAAALSAIPTRFCRVQTSPRAHPSMRIGVSMVEWIFLIIWAISIPERSKFLVSPSYGLAVFIVSGICYFIHTQYLYFFPDFSLPKEVSIRSIHGYAFNGELEEIQRLKESTKVRKINVKWDDHDPSNSKLPEGIERDSIWGHAFYGELEEFEQKRPKDQDFNMYAPYYSGWMKITPMLLAESNKQHHIMRYIQENIADGDADANWWVQGKICKEQNIEIARAYINSDFWDTSVSGRKHGVNWDTPAMFALSMGQYHVVEYLEREKGAKLHKLQFNAQEEFPFMNEEFARRYIGETYFKNN